MPLDLDVFDTLDVNQDMEIDTNDLKSYEMVYGTTYGLTDTDYNLVLENLDSNPSGAATNLQHTNLDDNFLNQYETDSMTLNNEDRSDYIDNLLITEGIHKSESISETDEIASDVGKIDTINSELDGNIEPQSGVPFESNTVQITDGSFIEGVFPVFDSTYDAVIPPESYDSSPYTHEKIVNEQLAQAVNHNPSYQEQFDEAQLNQIQEGETPDGYTWHHHEDPGKMQLVETELHDLARHTGGMSLWGAGY